MNDQNIEQRLAEAEARLARQEQGTRASQGLEPVPGIPSDLDREAKRQREERAEAQRVANIRAAKQREKDRPKQEARDAELAKMDSELQELDEEIKSLKARQLAIRAERQAAAGRPL